MNMVGIFDLLLCLSELPSCPSGSQILGELPDREELGNFKLFTSIVGGCKREEVLLSLFWDIQVLSLFVRQVCRYFLSSLMLANTENVDISSGEEDLTDPLAGTLDRLILAMDQFTLSLLSTTRHHEQLSDFQVRIG